MRLSAQEVFSEEESQKTRSDPGIFMYKNLQAAKTDHEKSLIQRQIDATDKRIDQLVYELYGLTDKEIKIVEEATAE